MFLSNILIRLCMIIHYIMNKNTFVVIVLEKVLKYIMLKITLKLMVNKSLRYLKMVNMLESKL